MIELCPFCYNRDVQKGLRPLLPYNLTGYKFEICSSCRPKEFPYNLKPDYLKITREVVKL